MSEDLSSGSYGSMRRATAIERQGTGFEMRTNIKARPGSQGTLFQGGKPAPQHRWPRGYSPTRMAQVAGALIHGGGGVSVTADKDAVLNSEATGISHPHLNVFSGNHTRRLMLEPIARADIPAPYVAALSGGIHLRVHGDTPQGEAAHYNPETRTINVNRQVWHAPERVQLAQADATLVHEMGHHIDFVHNAYAYDAMSRRHPQGFEGIRGMLEANADRAMVERFRNDPRNQRKTGFDVSSHTYGRRGYDSHLRQSGYVDPGKAERPSVVNSQQFGDEQLGLFNRGLPSRTWKHQERV